MNNQPKIAKPEFDAKVYSWRAGSVSDDPTATEAANAKLRELDADISAVRAKIQLANFPTRPTSRTAEQKKAYAKLTAEISKISDAQKVIRDAMPGYRYSDELSVKAVIDELAWLSYWADQRHFEDFARYAGDQLAYAIRTYGAEVTRATTFRELAAGAHNYLVEELAALNRAPTLVDVQTVLAKWCHNVAKRAAYDMKSTSSSDLFRAAADREIAIAKWICAGGMDGEESTTDTVARTLEAVEMMIQHNKMRDAEQPKGIELGDLA